MVFPTQEMVTKWGVVGEVSMKPSIRKEKN